MLSRSLLLASLTLALLSSTHARAQAQWRTVPHTPPFAAAMTWDGGLGAPVMLGGDPWASSFQQVYGPGGRISTLPVPVYQPSLAYDPGRNVLVLIGDVGGALTIFEGREQWTMVPAPSVSGLTGAVVVHDPTRATNVIAGYSGQQLRFFDWDGTTAALRLQVSRVGGWALRAIHHAGQGRVWLLESLGPLRMTSAYDGTTLLPLPGTPPQIAHMRHAYDAVGNRLIAFGGYNGILISPDNVNQVTWAFDGIAWTSLGTSAMQPGNGHACTNPQTGRVVAHAELLLQGSLWRPRPALHEWNGSGWSVVPGSESPTMLRDPNDSIEAQLDPTTGRALVGITYNSYYTYYGYDPRVWYEWDEQGFVPALPPPGVLIGFHEGVGRHVAFTYVAGQPRTYHRVGGVWTLVATSGPPTGPFWGWAWDGSAVILFGSRIVSSGPPLPETWAWDGQQWMQRTPANSPTARFSPKMVFDAARRRVVLFGGAWGQPLADTWEWDGVDWSQRAQGPMSPPQSQLYTMHWHAKRARTVLHLPQGTAPAAVWEWDGSAWQSQSVLGTALPAGAVGLFPTASGELLRVGLGVDRYDSAFPASYGAIGAGCAGSAGVPTLATALHDQPWLGDWITVRVGALPPTAGAVFLLTGFSTTSWAGVPLPLALAPLGAGPCELRVAADLVIPLAVANGLATWATAVPWEPALVGFELHQQALVPDPPANPFGGVLSNAATLRIGRR
ncbi:MAG TPA: hypothetical protein VFD82_13490 [Planctomycetota bacterium]|nr:hypothetical protein [Planctomycetota bacterium]